MEDALGAYTALYAQQTQAPYSLTRAESVLSHKIGSDKMVQVCMQKYFFVFPLFKLSRILNFLSAVRKG